MAEPPSARAARQLARRQRRAAPQRGAGPGRAHVAAASSRSRSASRSSSSLAYEAFVFLPRSTSSQLVAPGWFPRRGMFDLADALPRHADRRRSSRCSSRRRSAWPRAIYLSEYASPRVRRIVKPILEILAGIPSVVLGLLRPDVHQPERRPGDLPDRQGVQHAGRRRSASASSPSRSSRPISEDAMRAVPRSLREASYGLGARRITTTRPGRRPGRRLGHRGRAHPRRSRARSARRWSWPSPPAPPAARCGRSTRSARARR